MNINLIAYIIDFDSTISFRNSRTCFTSCTILYNYLCVSKYYLNNELLKNLSILNLPNNTKIKNNHLKFLNNLKILILPKNINISDEGLIYIPHIQTLKLDTNYITDDGLKLISNVVELSVSNLYENITDNGFQFFKYDDKSGTY